jgi:hypothetical protein
VLVLALAGCSAYEGPEIDAGGSESAGSATPTAAGDASPGTEPTDPLAAQPTDRVPGGVDEVVRSGNGSTLVVLGNMYRNVSYYRIYDERWRPTTPPMRVEVYLSRAQGTPRGFVARATASKRKGRDPLREWVNVQSDGRLSLGRAPVPIPRPDWYTRNTAWYEQPDGSVCSHVHHDHPGDPVRSSVDRGRSWQVTDTSAIPDDAGFRLWSCVVAGDRVVVETGGSEYARGLHTFERSTGALLASIPVGDGTPIDPYAWWLLPDGTLVANTDLPGVVVANDDTNAAVTFRGGPVRRYAPVMILDDQIVQVRADRQLAVSDDRGATWQLVDLELPAFS